MDWGGLGRGGGGEGRKASVPADGDAGMWKNVGHQELAPLMSL